ncbi:GNAT family N-acetyltransferase [Micromonospora pallida]|uniref:GNAT family N-acetyltransferase n=1 Tax=Micromonospora pallida TaxID=145854 RepID=UPI001FE12B08|nr:GNAT family N-acetyltransferase [Micromonospora pallida]
MARAYDMYSRMEVVRWFGFVPGWPLTAPEQAVDMVRRWHARTTPDGRYGIWAIELRGSGQVAGTILLKRLPGRDEGVLTDDIEVGWHLHPDCWGNGYATEAARAMVDREFAAGTEQIYAVVDPGNEPSKAVARRLGMTYVGRRTDWYGGIETDTFVLPADKYPPRS